MKINRLLIIAFLGLSAYSYGSESKSAAESEKTLKLYTAVSEGYFEVVKNFVDQQGMSVETAYYEGETLLMVAVRKEKANMVNFLLKRNADVYAQDKFYNNALFSAISTKNIEILNMILQKMRDENKVKEVLNSKFKMYSICSNSTTGQSIPSDKYTTALIHAIECKDTYIVELLLKDGANPNICDSYSRSPLKIAKQVANKDTIELLTKFGATEKGVMHTEDEILVHEGHFQQIALDAACSIQ